MSYIIAQLIASGIGAILFGPVLAVPLTPIVGYLIKVFYVPFQRKRWLEKSKKENRTVRAILQNRGDILNDNGTITGKVIGVYRYEYSGKSYIYRAVSATRLPDEITLYFVRNPKKATTAVELGIHECPRWWLCYICTSLTLIIALFVFFSITGDFVGQVEKLFDFVAQI